MTSRESIYNIMSISDKTLLNMRPLVYVSSCCLFRLLETCSFRHNLSSLIQNEKTPTPVV